MSTKLDRVAEIAKEKPQEQFTSLMHIVNEDMLTQCHKELNGSKTKIISFGANAYYEYRDKGGPKPPTFDFLGFTHYCSCSKEGEYRVKRKTSSKKFRDSLNRCKEWLMKSRTMPLADIMTTLKQKLNGYYRYYCISDNMKHVRKYQTKVLLLLYKWLNRRSQREIRKLAFSFAACRLSQSPY